MKNFKISKVKNHFLVQLGKTLQPEKNNEDEVLLPYISTSDVGVNAKSSEIKYMWFSKRDILKFSLEVGDLLVVEGGDIGKSAIWGGGSPIVGFQNHVYRIREKSTGSVVFADFWLQHLKNSGFFESRSGKVTLATLPSEKLKNAPFPGISKKNQQRIARYLQEKTAHIDALIENNERLISLCEEKTRAVIDSVFSKANSLIAIKHVVHINYDTLSSSSPDDMELRYADLSRVCPRGGIDPEVMEFKDAPSRARRIVHENDVLFASVGPFSKKVLSAKKDDEGAVVSTGFFVMKAKRGHHSRFLEKILQSTHVLSEVEKGAVGAIYSAINDTTFRNIRIPAFSYEEQVKFSEDMEAQISNLSALSEKAGRMNALLKEKRSALITAAVTGQIDIPE